MRLPHRRRDAASSTPRRDRRTGCSRSRQRAPPDTPPREASTSRRRLRSLVHLRMVGQRLIRTVVEASRRKQSPLQLSLVHALGERATPDPMTLGRAAGTRRTAVLPTPTASAISRSLIPNACFSRRTSPTFRIDILVPGIRSVPALLRATDRLIWMPIGSGPQPFTGLPAIVGMLPALRRKHCPRWSEYAQTGPDARLA